jgi:hypothetical protein
LAFALAVVSACTLYSSHSSGGGGGGGSTGGAAGRADAGGDTDGGAGGAGGGAGAPTPLPACGTDAPASGAQCTATANPDCRTAGYACSCACPAMAACAWSCSFADLASLADVHSLTITVGCKDANAPTMSLSIDAGFRAAAGGPALTIKNITPQVLGTGINQFACTFDVQPLIVGPIAPGTEQPATLSIGPTTCSAGTALNTLCKACGASARVALLLELDNDGSNPSLSNGAYSLTLARSSSSADGALFPIACTF